MTRITDNTFTFETSESKYSFGVFSMDHEFDKLSGVYFFSKRELKDGVHRHSLLYCGQTGDLSNRFRDHHKMKDALELGANCILVSFRAANEVEAIESDILAKQKFPCNDQNN